MQVLLGLLGLLALTSMAQVAGAEREECTDGSVWYQDCNRCWCIQGRAACTLKFCIKRERRSAPQCEDGSRWMQDNCNWCNCINGVGVCTKRACLPKWAIDAASSPVSAAAGRSLSAAEESEPECETGRWRDGCNWCRCSGTGRALCTKRACPPVLIEKLKDSPVCEDGARWREDCNWCSCVDGRAACTEKACVSEPLPVVEGTVGETRAAVRAAVAASGDRVSCEADSPTARWRQDCNWCRCLQGLSACTKRGCPPSLRSLLEGTPQCEGTVRWMQDGCNWCTCQNGIAACTLRACIDIGRFPQRPAPEQHEGQVYEPDCVAASRWTENCNHCQCVDGVKICTLKGCLTEVEDTCEEGSVWKRDCNWCTCKEGKPACSRRACRPLTEKDEEPSIDTCVEGSSWKADCNTCSCVNGHAVCTLRACIGVVRPAVIPDPSRPQIEERPRGQDRPAVIPDPTRPQIEERPRGQDRPAVIPDPTRPQIEERPRVRPAVIPDPSQPQIEERPQGRSISMPGAIPDPSRPQVQPRPRPAVSVPKDDRDCVPGSRFSIDRCNWCSCSSTGRGACTLMACFKPMEKVCEEGARWKQGCNWCDCDGGEAKCTQLACFDEVIREPVASGRALADASITDSSEEVRCRAGSVWTHGCSSCTCNAQGKVECEANNCPPDVDPAEVEDTCSEGAEWKQSCLVCRCGDDGKPLCSSGGCQGAEGADTAVTRRSSVQCRPGSTFLEDCNSCRCSSTGRKLCTKRLCRPGLAQPAGPACSNGSVFLDSRNCNWCFCDDGKIACSQSDTCGSRTEGGAVQAAGAASARPGIQGAEDEEPCEEGTTWMQNCNRCRCIDGIALCDRRACVPSTGPDTHGPEASEGGPPTSRCYKPADSGPCFASFRRFRFNPDTNRCEGFLYGGCAGNDNNFETAEDCQQTCGGDAPVLDAACDRRQCTNHREVAYMQARGCAPQYKDASCCPTSFSCTEPPSSDGDGCTYDGTTYAAGETVPVRNPCVRCRCSDGPLGTELSCTSVECPSVFQRPDPNCRRLYKLDQCCSYDKQCDGDATDDADVRSEVATCEADGRTYKEGDKMSLEDAPCQRCVCGANYTGPYGEGCAPIDCGYDSRSASRVRRGCVPLYYKARCCPISFICPGDSQVDVDQSQANPDGDTENVCTFDDITVALGKELATTQDKIKCSCQTPPSVTCVENPIASP